MSMVKFASVLFFLLGSLLPAMEWPLLDAAMVRNFGSNDHGRPVLGTVFEGEGEILDAESGDVVFSRSEQDTASRLPSPLGTWTAIDHDDGLVSIYSRYSDGGKGRPMSRLDRGAPVAMAGSSGWSQRNGLYFLLYDRKERRWVNASMVISSPPDTVSPQIQRIQFHKTDSGVDIKPVEGGQLRGLSQGRHAIIVNVVDTLQDTREVPLAPYRIVCSVNGEEAGALSFETFCARDGILMVSRNGLIPASRVYAFYPAFEAGDVQLNRGQAILEVIVEDIAGNSRSASARLIIE